MEMIRWMKINPIYVNHKKMNEIITDCLRKKGKHILVERPFFPCRNSNYLYGSFQRNITESRVEVRIVDLDGNTLRYIFLKNKQMFEKEEKGLSGLDAYNFLNEYFERKNNITIYKAFSGNKYKDIYKKIKLCVPKQINYLSSGLTGVIVKNAWKADVSSAFPYQMTKVLPTLHDYKLVSGRVEPNEEYPFAFYTKSHHISILNELDTRDFNISFYKYYKDTYDDSITDEEEETILCKKSEYSLANEFKLLYNGRKDNDDYKFFMNAAIGYFHKNSNPTLSILAAVTIARCNNDMLNRCYDLINEKNRIIFIATDSIAWKGSESNIATDNKYLGSFTYEMKDGMFFGQGPKAYQYLTKDNKLITKYAGMENGKEKENIPFGSLPKAAVQKKLITDDNGITMEV